MKDEILDQLRHLSRKAYDAADKHHSTTEFEPQLLAVLQFLKANPQHKPEFIQFFKDIFTSKEIGPPELIGFCMRDLQWIEIRNFAQMHLDNSKEPLDEFWLPEIIGAYDKEWIGDDLYEYFQTK